MSPEPEEEWNVPDPTFAERLITWGKILWQVKKTVVLLLGIGAVSVGGNIAEVNPWKEAAIEVGLVEVDEPEQMSEDPGIPSDVIWSEITNQGADIDIIADMIKTHTHPAADTSHEHEQTSHSHPYAKAKHSHPIPEQELTGATKGFIAAQVKSQIEILVPPDHLKLH